MKVQCNKTEKNCFTQKFVPPHGGGMEIFMNYRRNRKYFEQVNRTYPIVISAVLIAIGAIMVVFISAPIGLPILALGIALATVISAMRIKDGEIDTCTSELGVAFKEDFDGRFIRTDVRKYKNELRYGSGSAVHSSEPISFETYYFDDNTAMFKKGNDGRERSSVFSFSRFLLKNDTICIGNRRVSLLNDDVSDNFCELKYADLLSVEYRNTTQSATVYRGRTQYRHIVMYYNDGSVAADLPILADTDADSYISEISSRISRAKEQQ